MLIQLLGVFAEFERATIIDRVVAGMERKAARGGWPGGTIPYGLRLDDDHHLAIEPSEFPIVERIFTRYGTRRAGTTTIATELNNDGHRTRTGRRWSAKVVLGILRNRGYLGEVSFHDVVHQAESRCSTRSCSKRPNRCWPSTRGLRPPLRRRPPRVPTDRAHHLLAVTADYVGAAATASDTATATTCAGPPSATAKTPAEQNASTQTPSKTPSSQRSSSSTATRVHHPCRRPTKPPPTLTVRQRHDELAATDAELAKTEAAVERYMHAFEAGTLTADMFAERVHELGNKAKPFAPDKQCSPR